MLNECHSYRVPLSVNIVALKAYHTPMGRSSVSTVCDIDVDVAVVFHQPSSMMVPSWYWVTFQ